jgi:hypothetical protein
MPTLWELLGCGAEVKIDNLYIKYDYVPSSPEDPWEMEVVVGLFNEDDNLIKSFEPDEQGASEAWEEAANLVSPV